MVTLKEAAEMCNVSVTTVSNILNGKAKAGEETKKRVLEVVKEMGYQPNYIAQGLRNNKTKTVGIIAEDLAQFTTPAIVESIMKYCEAMGYRTVVQNLRLYGRWEDRWYHNDDAYHSVLCPSIQQLKALKVDGIIYIAGHARVIEAFPEDFQIPAVMTYAYNESNNVPSVVLDDAGAAYQMVKHLLDKGHRKIGVIGGLATNIHTQKRLLGYQNALFEAEVLFDPALVCYGDFERETGYKYARELIEDHGVSAVFGMTDRIAGGVYDYLEEKGLVAGKDISVVGFDDQDIASFFRPPLTTARLPLYAIGTRSAEVLLDMLKEEENKPVKEGVKNQNDKVEFCIPAEIMYRGSVGEWKQE